MKRMTLVFAIAAVTLAACGDDDDEGADSFVADAEAACIEGHDAATQAYVDAFESGAPGDEPEDLEDAALKAHAAAEEALASGLEAVEAPGELEGVQAELVELHEKRGEMYASADASVQDGNVQAAEAYRDLAHQYEDESHAVARGLGMSECAGVLPDEDVQAVTAVTEDALTAEGAGSVDINEIEGYRDNFAEVDVVPTGGRYDSQAIRVLLRPDESGEWAFVSIQPFG
jgi:hypothetical protein